jgi:peptidoglycan/LPS O-acetylase OafA/YrhL
VPGDQRKLPESIGKHLPALDGLRGIAILLVLFFHLEIRDVGSVRLFSQIVRMGWLGVDLFFVLSGFLITGILLDSNKHKRYFANFYARRVLRILPLYYGFLLLAFYVLPHFPALSSGPTPRPLVQLAFWLHFSNVLVTLQGWQASPALVPHFWSLAVEEQFYLVWPLVVYLCSQKALLRICAGCIVSSLLVRVGLRFVPWPWYACQTFTLARLDALAFGGLVALLLRAPAGVERVARRAGGFALATGMLCLALFAARGFQNAQDPLIATLGMSSFDAFAASAVAFGATAAGESLPARILRSPLLTTAGRYSYGTYVLHVWVLKLVNGNGFAIADLNRRWGHVLAAHAVNLSLNLGFSFGLAALSYQLFERRFLALKARFAP